MRAFVLIHRLSLTRAALRWILLAVILSGCASQASRPLIFPDGTRVDTITVENRTSLLNSNVITAVENDQTKQVQVFVLGGVSAGQAAFDAAQIAAMMTPAPESEADKCVDTLNAALPGDQLSPSDKNERRGIIK